MHLLRCLSCQHASKSFELIEFRCDYLHIWILYVGHIGDSFFYVGDAKLDSLVQLETKWRPPPHDVWGGWNGAPCFWNATRISLENTRIVSVRHLQWQFPLLLSLLLLKSCHVEAVVSECVDPCFAPLCVGASSLVFPYMQLVNYHAKMGQIRTSIFPVSTSGCDVLILRQYVRICVYLLCSFSV